MKRFLRSPRVIVGEVLTVVAAGLARTLVPQAEELSKARRFATDHPGLSGTLHALGLDRVLASPPFLITLLLAAGSLVVVLHDQWRRLARRWPERLTEASFRGAPFRREVVRARPAAGAHASFRSSGRVGLLGSPLFHLGLLLVVVAGIGQWLFSAEAFPELYEGETIEPAAWYRVERWAGPLAAPLELAAPLTLVKLEPARYADGTLRGVSARLAVGGAEREVAINSPLDLGREALHLGSVHGPAALVEVVAQGRADRRVIALREEPGGGFGARWRGPDVELIVRGRLGADGSLPDRLEARVLRDGGLLFAGVLPAGGGVELAGGFRVALMQVRYWGVLRATRDPSLVLAYAGFLLAAVGAVLMFAVVKVDTAVVVTPCPEGERVLVALRADRFPAIFEERFERLAAEALAEERPAS